MDIQTRFEHAELIAAHYTRFEDFAYDGMAFLGFPLTDMQKDIAQFMQDGPRLRMVMAQRGEAKSTLAALYAVWRIIHRAQTRVLIVSGGEKQASEVAILVIRLIMSWDILEYLRPDKLAGDRASVEAFDIHHSLKGLDKSPSVACVGVTANLQGKRADLLIPDDVETSKNGLTAVQRGQLLVLSKDFSSICTHGDILYLGTPQTKDSIYNTLMGRGFCIRIWPGRFPTEDEVEKYGDRLAPFLADRIKADPSLQTGGGIDGKRGKPADPGRYGEEDLISKELDQGPEGFQLQYMLDTSLADEARQQLKLSNLLVANFDWTSVPEIIQWQAAPKYAVELSAEFPIPLTRMYHPVPVECVFQRPSDVVMYIDPAGGGADEMGYGVSFAVGPYIHVADVGGLKGGLTEANGKILCDVIREFNVKHITVESNMGHGLFEINLRAILEKEGVKGVGVKGEYSTGQKERRIIDSMVSASQRHRIIIHARVFESDIRYGKQHSQEKRMTYSVFYQFSNITTDRNSLEHDDRLEAMAGCVRHWKGVLALDEEKASQARRLAEARGFMENPMGYDMPRNSAGRGIRRTVYNRRAK
jgi:hypothetical protein